MAAPRRSTARTAVLTARRPLPDLRAILPTGRSIVVGVAVLVAAGGLYLIARDTSLFAVRTLDVRGATPQIRAQVRTALASIEGRSLLRVGGGDIAARLAAITGVRSFRYDRRFPNTLEVVIHAERPVLVLRQGARGSYLVSASGRVLRTLPHPRLSRLPRLWVPRSVDVSVGASLPRAAVVAAAAVTPLRTVSLGGRVAVVESSPTALALKLVSGFEVRLGDIGDLRLKLAIASRILHMTGAAAGAGYVDVSVPERPVLDTNPQVGG